MKKILCHVSFILSLMIIVLFSIDVFNEAMQFLNNSITKAIVLILCIVSLTLSVIDIYGTNKK